LFLAIATTLLLNVDKCRFEAVRRMTVNHDVTGSSPVGGAKENRMNKRKTACSCGSSYI